MLRDRVDSSLTAFHSLNPSTSYPLNKTSDLLERLQNTSMGQRTIPNAWMLYSPPFQQQMEQAC